MKTRLAVVASSLALVAALGMNGCSGNRAAVQVQAICFPTEDCTFGPTCDLYWGGYAGIVRPGTLVVFVQVGNQLPDNENLDVGRLNTNDAHVTEINVAYEGAQGGSQSLGSNSWVPASGSTIVAVPLGITASAGEILANVTLSGYYDDGRGFTTGEFPISIAVGTGACGTGSCAGATTMCPATGTQQCPVNCPSTTTTAP